MTQLDSTICPPCGRSSTGCRHSHLGYLAACAESETWFYELVEPLCADMMTVFYAWTAAIEWHRLISALVEHEHLTWHDAQLKAAAMIKEVAP
ncbi:hypothetical protein SAMN05421874_128109 [Nonomuraea maritima]|uniref:Uncharacterized protein n=1 Tax=Nonomuraea maritima TaxID=683260 RepID=A0A1G9MNB5_9ACTN|nr:hypothetical protein [Nonomuraea maritima]SDL75614.1 hypothetical protein SAMN05421874_128109 [Nonomuraea maritima]